MTTPTNHFTATRMLSFDLETTSPDPKTARIVTSALVAIDGSKVDKVEHLADPGIEIPKAATEIHGISTEKARAEGRPHEDVLRETVERIREGWDHGLTLIVYNAPFDLSALYYLTEGEFTVDGPVFDPLVVDRTEDRMRKGKRTLGNVAAHYGVSLDNAHEATADAMAAARIAWHQIRRYPHLAQMSTDELMEYQAVSHSQWAKNLKNYFAGKGMTDRDVNENWPMLV